MDNYLTRKLKHWFKAEICIPWSKSITNRVLLLWSLWTWKTIITNVLHSEDTRCMLDALHILWAWIVEEGNRVEIYWFWESIKNKSYELFLWNAWTAVRFLTAFAWTQDAEIIIDWTSRMRERPLSDLLNALKSLWAWIISNNWCPPVTIKGAVSPLSQVNVAWDISSQYLSWLLLTWCIRPNWLVIDVIGDLVSVPYVQLTIYTMNQFWITVQNEDDRRFIVPHQSVCSSLYDVEADATWASYWQALALLTGSEITINLWKWSKQWDKDFLKLIQSLWAEVEYIWETKSVIRWTWQLKDIWEIDMNSMPDSAMTLAIIAPFLSSKTTIRNVENMRVKETDRIAALCTELSKLWVKTEELKDWLVIYPCKEFRTNQSIHTYKDHRMAMCFAILWSVIWNLSIEDPACCAKTYPNFFEQLNSIL